MCVYLRLAVLVGEAAASSGGVAGEVGRGVGRCPRNGAVGGVDRDQGRRSAVNGSLKLLSHCIISNYENNLISALLRKVMTTL